MVRYIQIEKYYPSKAPWQLGRRCGWVHAGSSEDKLRIHSEPIESAFLIQQPTLVMSRPQTESIQNSCRSCPDLRQNPFRTHWDVILNPCRTHAELIQNSSGTHSGRIQSHSLQIHSDLIQNSRRILPDFIQKSPRSLSDFLHILAVRFSTMRSCNTKQ